jgi:hypothetical protein
MTYTVRKIGVMAAFPLLLLGAIAAGQTNATPLPGAREVDGAMYDFTEVLRAGARLRAAEGRLIQLSKDARPKTDPSGRYPARQQAPGYAQKHAEYEKAKAEFEPELESFRERWGLYFIAGTVVEVVPGGLIVDCKSSRLSAHNGSTFFVVGYDKEGTVVDGSAIEAIGIVLGRRQFVQGTYKRFVAANKPTRAFNLEDVRPLPR